MGPAVRSFSINADAQDSKIEVKICETPGVKAENLGLATWGSSYILANQLHRWKEDAIKANEVQKQNEVSVLELGAGTSLVGISAAAVWNLPVIVTDLPTVVPGLAQNILANQDTTLQNRNVTCGTLDWSQPDTIHLHHSSTTVSGKANIILAADTVYADDHPELLTSTIKQWLAPGPHSRAILCYVLRHSYIDIIRDLWESFEAAGLECIEEGKQDADPDAWDDVAPFEWCVWRWKQQHSEANGGEQRRS